MVHTPIKMNNTPQTTLQKCVAAYHRGLMTGSEFANCILDELVVADASRSDIEDTLATIPVEVDRDLLSRIQEIGESDYLIRDFVFSDTRTEAEARASSLARQPIFRRICPILVDIAAARGT